MNDHAYTSDEMMTVTASRHLADGAVCFVGIGLPSEAAISPASPTPPTWY
jgi:glutaconate CoA-transferase subunit B